jgi:uncharacterized coiled-coil protein SlyX|tara:strand:+ start:161 stop:379 length:219 start_codon:yes stop_codon:yes gene_type:complete
MDQFSEEELDKINGRMAEMEKNLAIVQENLYVLNGQIKDTQNVLIKFARTQHEISKRITHWPYVAVDTSANR